MSNGFIIVLMERLVFIFFWLDPSELFKAAGLWLVSKIRPLQAADEQRTVRNFLIDTYILGKWALVLTLALRCETASWSKWVVWYLIASNLFGYFYYHAWGPHGTVASLTDEVQEQRERRRFVNLMQAVAFSVLSFAFLFQFHYASHFSWPDGVSFANAVQLSFANSFTLAHDGFNSQDSVGRTLVLLQVANVFTFFTILIGNSVPTVGR